MIKEIDNNFEYFAFISYKREDEKWAKWLQKKLEFYRIPVSVRKKHPGLPERIRPVFKDTTDLEPGVLAQKIKMALDKSKFLVVICSPRSANSIWVSKEVQTFIDSGREDYIIPFIIGGKPNAEDPNEECFPEGLRQLSGERELLGANINEMGREAAVIKVISRMFNLRFDTLWQRYEKAKRKKLIGIAFISIIAIAIAIWMGALSFKLDRALQDVDKKNKELIAANNLKDSLNKSLGEERDRADLERDRALLAKNNLKIANDSIKLQSQLLQSSYIELEQKNVELREERDNVIRSNWNMRENLARAIAERADRLIDEGDAYRARMLCLDVTPQDLSNPDIPFMPEIESVLRRANQFETAAQYAEDPITHIALSPDKNQVAVMTDEEILIFNIDDGRLVNHLNHNDQILTFGKDNLTLITRNYLGEISIWDLSTNNITDKLQGSPSYGISALIYNKEDDLLITSNTEGVVEVFNINSKSSYPTIYNQGSGVLTFNADKRLLISTSYDEQNPCVLFYDYTTYGLLGKLELESFKSPISQIALNPKGNELAMTLLEDSRVYLFDIVNHQFMFSLEDPNLTQPILSMSFSHDGKMLVGGFADGSINIWNIENQNLVYSNRTHRGAIPTLITTHDDRIISGSWDTKLSIAEFPKILLFWNGYIDIEEIYEKNKIGVSHDGFLTAHFNDRNVIIQNREMDVQSIFTVEDSLINSIAISPNNQFIALVTDDGVIKFFDFKGKCLYNPINTKDKFTTPISFSPDGQYLVSGGRKDLLIWDIKTGELKHRLKSHQSMITSISWSPNGKYILSGSWDGTAKVWDPISGVCIATYGVPNVTDAINESEDDSLTEQGFNIIDVKFSQKGKSITLIRDTETNNICTFEFQDIADIISSTRRRFKKRKLSVDEKHFFNLE